MEKELLRKAFLAGYSKCAQDEGHTTSQLSFEEWYKKHCTKAENLPISDVSGSLHPDSEKLLKKCFSELREKMIDQERGEVRILQ